MSRNVKKSKEESLEILREYLTTPQSKQEICRKYHLNRNWIYRNLRIFAVEDKKCSNPMARIPVGVSLEKTYRDCNRDELLQRIQSLEQSLHQAEMARDAYDEMIRLAEQYYNIPIRKKSAAK